MGMAIIDWIAGVSTEISLIASILRLIIMFLQVISWFQSQLSQPHADRVFLKATINFTRGLKNILQSGIIAMSCNWVRASIGYKQRLGGGYGRFRQRIWPATGLDWPSRQRDAAGLGFLSPRLEAEASLPQAHEVRATLFPKSIGFSYETVNWGLNMDGTLIGAQSESQ